MNSSVQTESIEECVLIAAHERVKLRESVQTFRRCSPWVSNCVPSSQSASRSAEACPLLSKAHRCAGASPDLAALLAPRKYASKPYAPRKAAEHWALPHCLEPPGCAPGYAVVQEGLTDLTATLRDRGEAFDRGGRPSAVAYTPTVVWPPASRRYRY